MAKKKKPSRDEKREDRITMEIVVDAYGPEERAMGWYYYLEDQLRFSFVATCISKRAISPLKLNEEVQVIGMPDESECEKEVFVTIRWSEDELAVPLAQLKPKRNAHPDTKLAVEDWHYWVAMGYQY